MKKLKLCLLILSFIWISLIGKAQSINTLTQYDRNYQACLDKGINMLNCSQVYYNQMDSLLNVVYNNIRRPLDPTGKSFLKQEQIKWLHKRDVYFKKLDREYSNANSEGFTGNDSRMIAIDNKAKFVRERVEALLRRLNKT